MNRRTVSAHVLRALAEAQAEGRMSSLQTLIDEIGVRRADVRAAVSALHQEGYVDALTMRLTLRGFAIGQALIGETLPELRPATLVQAVAA